MGRRAKGRLVRQGDAGLELVRSKGSHLYGPRRRQYIDFMAGWCVGNLGWDQREIKTAIKRFKGPDYVFPGYGYKPWDELAELLTAIAPGQLTRCFRATGGSEAVDLALQAAMVHTKRRKFLSLEDSYHGNTIAGLSVGASETRKTHRNLLAHCQKIEPPLDGKAADRLEALLKRRDVAAFIMEPISINLGVLIPEREFMQRARALCRRYGTLFIADEVATGFGRTGKMFACEHFGLQPDVLCLAKAITGGAGGMGAVVTTAAVAQSMEENGVFYSTYGWHPLSTAAAIASLRYWRQHRTKLLDHIERTSNYFRTRLFAMEFERKPKLHIRGLAIGLDVGSESYSGEIQERAQEQGLLLSAEGATLLLLPALNIPAGVARKGLDILARSA